MDSYLPGFKAGGPIRTLSAVVETLSGEFQFLILTRDRDLGDQHPYAGIHVDTWIPISKALAYYTSDLSLANLKRRVEEAAPNLLYLNSFFSPFTIKLLLLRKLRLIRRCPVILAPRGEFSDAALSLKKRRKQLYMKLVFPLLYGGITWQASTEREAADINRILRSYGLGGSGRILVARDVHAGLEGPQNDAAVIERKPAKQPGGLRLVFLSRISRMKNLKYAIDIPSRLSGKVILDIYGPQEDPDLWAECQSIIAKAPENIRIQYRGTVTPVEVRATLARYHFFILPTLGENFGHVILEALSAGCPVLISDRTPWSGLQEKGIGWDLPLQNPELWNRALQQCIEMDDPSYQAMSLNCMRFFREWVSSSEILEENRRLFASALQDPQGRDPI